MKMSTAGLHLLMLSAAFLIACIAGPPIASASPERWQLEGWGKTDFSNALIDFGEIRSGGPPKDGIPPIDDPKFKPVREIADLAETEPVIGLEINGDARAYPLQILIWHEIVNDTVGGEPVTITYCPLCNSALVFDRRVDGTTLDLGTTGKLRNSDLVMYDRQTESWWQQFTGRAIVGKMAGTKLKTIPARLESFAQFKTRLPKGQVLVPGDATKRPYGRNPYVGYDTAKAPFLYDGEMPDGIDPMSRVVVVTVGSEPKAIPLADLRKRGSYRLGDVTVSWKAGQNSALDTDQIKDGRDVGTVVAQRDTNEGKADVVYDVTFAFVFHAFHPDRPFVKP